MAADPIVALESAPEPDDSAPSAGPLARLAGLAIILAAWAAGELLSRHALVPLPGSVIGMLLLTAALQLEAVPERLVAGPARLLVRWMALFFVPAGVGVLLYLPLLRAHWVAVVTAAVASIVAVLVTVGVLVQRMAPDA